MSDTCIRDLSALLIKEVDLDEEMSIDRKRNDGSEATRSSGGEEEALSLYAVFWTRGVGTDLYGFRSARFGALLPCLPHIESSNIGYISKADSII